ncbi:MAG: hypothetical protein ACFBSF_08985 [Leptolyngbyaceae cyanobacterium]
MNQVKSGTASQLTLRRSGRNVKSGLGVKILAAAQLHVIVDWNARRCEFALDRMDDNRGTLISIA